MSIVQNNLSEYADPRMYDSENYDFEPDGPFILALAKQLGGSVLELGCGTGRLTIPLAQHKMNITGLDVVPGMIEFAKQKSGDASITWILADVRNFHLKQKFRLIFEAGSVFHHMLTRQDQEAYLARVREHLEDNGRLVINILFPKSKYLVSGSEVEEWFTTQHPDGYEVRVSGIDQYDDFRQVKTETAYRRWQDASGKEMQLVAPLSLRYVFPQEMEALMFYNGFEIADRYGDFDKSPVTNESRQIIYVFRKRANFAP